MTGDHDSILSRRDEGMVVWLTLNRPDARNALSSALMAALDAALVEAASDPSVRAVVIAGSGQAFCAGHDLREVRSLAADPVGTHAPVRPVLGA